jgi:hypothetical protein
MLELEKTVKEETIHFSWDGCRWRGFYREEQEMAGTRPRY